LRFAIANIQLFYFLQTKFTKKFEAFYVHILNFLMAIIKLFFAKFV